MSTLADRTITALRTNHDDLAARVTGFSDADLDRQSGSSEWDVAQVLSHMGSGAEIGLASLDRALAGEPAPEAGFNEQVWARWNAMSQREKADGYLVAAEQLVAAYERLDAQARATLKVPLSFLPFPADVTLLSGMRLNEVAMHSWDVRVAFDPNATLAKDEAAVLLEQVQGPLAFLIGFLGKPAILGDDEIRVTVRASDEAPFGLTLSDSVALSAAHAEPHVEITGPTEAVLRLLSGRLPDEHTPAALTTVGDAASLAELRQVFPGF